MNMTDILFVFAALSAIFLFITYGCFRFAFYAPKRKIEVDRAQIELPKGKIYEPFHDVMTDWILEARKLPHEDVNIVSRDGLKLTGKFYQFAPGAPIEIMFHGYRGARNGICPVACSDAFLLGAARLWWNSAAATPARAM